MVSTKPPGLEAVYRDEFSFVYRLLRYRGAPDSDVEDLAHDVFMVVHRRLDDYEPTRPIRPWLFGIVYRTVRRHKERQSRRTAIDAITTHEPQGSPPTADTLVENAQAWERLRAGLQKLSYEQRAVVVMHDIEEHTAPEIAAQLEVPVNTIYSRLRLGRKHLAALVGRGADDEKR